MIPRLYESTETTFSTFGICALAEAVSCLVTEERNGQYVLSMDYPTDGTFFDELKVDRIILAQAHENDTQAQPFRIESIGGDIGGIVTIEAVHISYQLNWIMATRQTTTSGTAQTVLRDVGLMTTSPFTLYSDITTTHSITLDEVTPFRTAMGGMKGSFLDVFGGEYEWDRYDVHLWNKRGADNGVRITYGKNLTGLEWETDVSNTYTSVVAYWKQEQEGVTTYVQSDIVSLYQNQNPFAFERTIAVDATGDFQNQPSPQQLHNWAASYVHANAVEPTVTVKVDYVPLWQTEEYKDYADFEQLNMCDDVTIIYPPLNLELKAKVVKTVYNVLLDRYDSIEINTIKRNLADTIWMMQREIKNMVSGGSRFRPGGI